MDSLVDASSQALRLLFSGDPELWSIVWVSVSVSARALILAAVPAVPIAALLAFARFPGRRLLIVLSNTMLSIPAVVVGLTVYLLLSRSGPLGELRLLFTTSAMILGQTLMAFPLLVALTHAALRSLDLRAWETARTLGASPIRAGLTMLREARFGVVAACVTAYGRIVAEVGCALMVGGNILHHTRTISTAIALETSKGDFAQGIALGIVLLLVSLVLNAALYWLPGKVEVRYGG